MINNPDFTKPRVIGFDEMFGDLTEGTPVSHGSKGKDIWNKIADYIVVSGDRRRELCDETRRVVSEREMSKSGDEEVIPFPVDLGRRYILKLGLAALVSAAIAPLTGCEGDTTTERKSETTPIQPSEPDPTQAVEVSLEELDIQMESAREIEVCGSNESISKDDYPLYIEHWRQQAGMPHYQYPPGTGEQQAENARQIKAEAFGGLDTRIRYIQFHVSASFYQSFSEKHNGLSLAEYLQMHVDFANEKYSQFGLTLELKRVVVFDDGFYENSTSWSNYPDLQRCGADGVYKVDSGVTSSSRPVEYREIQISGELIEEILHRTFALPDLYVHSLDVQEFFIFGGSIADECAGSYTNPAWSILIPYFQALNLRGIFDPVSSLAGMPDVEGTSANFYSQVPGIIRIKGIDEGVTVSLTKFVHDGYNKTGSEVRQDAGVVTVQGEGFPLPAGCFSCPPESRCTGSFPPLIKMEFGNTSLYLPSLIFILAKIGSGGSVNDLTLNINFQDLNSSGGQLLYMRYEGDNGLDSKVSNWGYKKVLATAVIPGTGIECVWLGKE